MEGKRGGEKCRIMRRNRKKVNTGGGNGGEGGEMGRKVKEIEEKRERKGEKGRKLNGEK